LWNNWHNEKYGKMADAKAARSRLQSEEKRGAQKRNGRKQISAD
jgi:hypothetical protein